MLFPYHPFSPRRGSVSSHYKPVGSKGLEPLRAGLKVRCAAVTPRPQNVGRVYAFQTCRFHFISPGFQVVALRVELSTTRLSAVSGQPALDYQCANVVVVRASRLLLPGRRSARTTLVGMAGLEPASPCSQSTWVRRYPTSRQSFSPSVRAGGFEPPISWSPTRRDARLRHVLIFVGQIANLPSNLPFVGSLASCPTVARAGVEPASAP